MRATSILVLACMSCGAEEVGPIARIDLEPENLCEGASDTAVIVSGKGSVGLNGNSTELDFRWSFSREPAQIVRGGTEDPEIVVKFSASTAVQVHLEVSDGRGRSAVRETILGLTRVSRNPCHAGCAAHEICAAFAGVDLCVDDVECVEEDECGCLLCLADDTGARRCIAP